MGAKPKELRAIIAWKIRELRMKKFPGRGGGKKCAEAFGVSPQQWSPWERGMRTPDDIRLAQIAEFFGVTPEYLQCDTRPPWKKEWDEQLVQHARALQSDWTSRDTGSHPSGIIRDPAPFVPIPPNSDRKTVWHSTNVYSGVNDKGEARILEVRMILFADGTQEVRFREQQ